MTAQVAPASSRLGSLLACQIAADTQAEGLAGQKRQRRKTTDKPLTFARYKPTLSDAIKWVHAAWEGMPNSVIKNSWQKSGLLTDKFRSGEGDKLIRQRDTAEQVIAEQYAATDQLLTEFNKYFPDTLTAAEYAEGLPGEDVAIEQPPTAIDFVEQVLGASDSSSSEDEEEEQVVTAEVYENSLQMVEKFRHQNLE